MSLDPFVTQVNLLAVLIVFAGSLVRGYTDFGSGLVMAPLLTLMWGPVDALATTTGLGLLATVQLFHRAIPLTNWREIGPMIVATVIFIPVGTGLLISLDPELIKKIIAVLVLFVSLITLRGWTYKGPRGTIPSFLAGAVGALINGISAVGGPAAVLYLMALPDEARTHRANIVVIVGLMGAAVFITLSLAGKVTAEIWTNLALLAIPSIAGVWGGARLFSILPGQAFRLIVLWFLVAISIAILLA